MSAPTRSFLERYERELRRTIRNRPAQIQTADTTSSSRQRTTGARQQDRFERRGIARI